MAFRVEPVIEGYAIPVIIADSGSLSAAGYLKDRRLVGLLLATSTEGAVVTFQVSVDGITYYDLYGPSGEYSITFSDPSALIVPAVDFMAFPYVKVRTGTSAAPTTQTGAQTITLLAA